MITLRNNDGSASIEVAIPRSEAALIAPHLAPGWRFVEEVEIGAAVEPQIASPPAPKTTRSKASPKPAAKPEAEKKPTLYAEAETEVRRRLSRDSNSPKAFADLCGSPWKDSAVRWVINTLREAGEVEVSGAKRGTKYRLVERPTAPAPAQAAE